MTIIPSPAMGQAPPRNCSEFLRTVLPPIGRAVIAYRWQGMKFPWTSRSYDLSDDPDLMPLQIWMDVMIKLGTSTFKSSTGKFRVEAYFETATQLQPVKSRKHGSSKTTAAVACVGMDIDCWPKQPKVPGQASYPKRQDALRILGNLLPPSIIVSSGSNGLHVYWLLDQPIVFDSQRDRDDYKALVCVWESTVAGEFRQHGHMIDLGQNRVSRKLRLPGTMHLKSRQTVEIIGGNGQKFSQELLLETARNAAKTYQKTPMAHNGYRGWLFGSSTGVIPAQRVTSNSVGKGPTSVPKRHNDSTITEIWEVFERNIPVRFGTRHNCLKRIVCILKTDPALRKKTEFDFSGEFRNWFEKSKPAIKTKDYNENWRDFSEL